MRELLYREGRGARVFEAVGSVRRAVLHAQYLGSHVREPNQVVLILFI